MVQRLYLGDAFGWETKSITKVGISQLREKNIIGNKCAKAELKNHQTGNLIKVLGYIPVLNIIIGSLAIHGARKIQNTNQKYNPHTKELTIVRGVSMILFGPLLVPVDAIKTIYDRIVAAVYAKKHPELMEQFNCPHKHNIYKNPKGERIEACPQAI